MSTPAGDGLVGNAHINVNANTDPALHALNRFSRDATGRIQDVRGRFVSESALINRSLTNAAGGGDRFGGSLRALGGAARIAGGILGRVGIGIAGLGAAAGTAAPLLAGIVTTLEQVAPAGAVAATGMLAIVQASAVLKLGMVGVEDAATAAFDTSAAGAKKFDEALKKLSPNARAFALQVKALQPAFQKFQQGIQNRLFAGLADELKSLSTAALPVVRKNFNDTAVTLNKMAVGATTAARELATSGTLGKAMTGANQGLSNLRQIPGQVVTALGQLAASGAPAFDKLTGAAAGVATSISEKLSTAFKSGALQTAVDTAVGLLKDLGTVAGNVFATLGNIMGPVQAAGGGLIGTLVEITGALKNATGTKAFQDAIGALAKVMGTLARTVGPLLGQALAAIAPIFTALGPPVERLITNLGSALSPIIDALGPVLSAAATAVGVLVDAFSPLLPVIGELIASLLPPLVPVIDAIAQAWAGAAPIVQQLGEILTTTLAPIIAQLPAILAPVIDTFTQLTSQILPVVSDLLVALAPSLASLGQSFGNLLAAVGPLLGVLGQLIGGVLVALLPLLTPIIGIVSRLAAVFADQLGNAINNVVVPALSLITALLSGDTSAAWNAFKDLISGVGTYVTTTLSNMGKVVAVILGGLVTLIRQLPGRIFSALGVLGGGLLHIAHSAWGKFRQAAFSAVLSLLAWARGVPGRLRNALSSLGGLLAALGRSALARFLSAVRSGAASAISYARGIPGRIRGALGGLGGLLYSAGRSIIQGLVNGIRSMAGNVKSAVGSVLSDARDLLPFSPAKEGPFSGRGWTLYSGQSISEALAEGIIRRQALVQRAARTLAENAQSTVSMAVSTTGTPMAAAAPGGVLPIGTMRTPVAASTLTGPQTVIIQLTNEGVIGSQLELDNWLTKSLDRLNRQRRLPGFGSAA